MKAITHQLIPRRFALTIFCLLALPLILFVSRFNYNLFHSFADGASIVIAASTFAIIWNSRHRVDNNYFLFTGIAFLFFSFLNAMHVLGNKNMGVFPAHGNLGPTFYIANRYLLSISLLCAPLFIHRRVKAPVVFGAYALFCALVVLSVFYWKVFPDCFVEGVGLTPFKVVSDYVTCLFLAGSIVLLLRHRESFDPRVLRGIVSSIVLLIATGLTFTLYSDPFGITNMMGHVFQLASFYVVYIVFVETSLTKPHEILFRELKRNEEKLVQNVRKLDEANVELNQEITERKQAEETLKNEQARLSAILENLPVGVWIVDTTGEVRSKNKAADLVWAGDAPLGGRSEDYAAYRAWDVESGNLLETDHYPLTKTLRTGLPVTPVELRIRRFDGTEGFIVMSTVPIRSADGLLTGAVGINVDITERKRMEDDLRESEDRYRRLFENLNSAVVLVEPILDGDGRLVDLRYLMANPAVSRHLKKSPGEMVGRLYSEVFHYPGPNPAFAIYEQVLSTGEPYKGELLLPATNRHYDIGVYRPAPGRLALLLSDITERRQAEEQIRKSLHEKEVLLKEIHHRVKNNMQVISSLVALQAEYLPDESVRAVLKDVTQRVRSMALVHEKLYQSTDLARIDFAAYVRSLLSYLWRAHRTESSRIRLTQDLEPVTLSVEAAVPCGLILNELVSNALKHAFDEGSEGEVTVSLQSDAQDQVRLCVRDNGRGMPAGFDWRASPSLGLRLIQMLAGQLKATVEVSCERGTEFAVAFEVRDRQ